MAETTPIPTGTDRPESEAQLWQYIRDALRGMEFGTVTLVVQNGLVIQVDRTEKRRLPRRSEQRG
jgi:hypothetical protein